LASLEDQLRNQALNDNDSLNSIPSINDSFVVPSIRSSVRLHERQQAEEQARAAQLPHHKPETTRCRFTKSHNGLGCASIQANHGPEFYSSETDIIPCPHCGALRLHSEAWDKKNSRPKMCKHCAGGKVHSEQMQRIFAGFQEPFVNVSSLANIFILFFLL
jgi:hypothetical protein